MNSQVKTIIEEEWKKITVLFTKHDENWHNGQTYKFENSLIAKDNRYFQFKTIIETGNQDYFIYDEIIARKNKLCFISRLCDDEKRKVWESIIYFENNEIVKQLRCVSYRRFFNEVENNEELIKQESRNTTIIRTSFLDFIKNTANKKQVNNIRLETEDKYWIIKRLTWKMYHGFIFFLAWGAISIIAKIIITPLIVSFVSASVITWLPFAIAGLAVGICIKQLYQFAKKLKKWMFPNVKDKYQVEFEQKIEEQTNKINNLEVELHYWQDICLTSKPAAVIQEKFLNCLQKIGEINKIKPFKRLKKELIKNFKTNKKVLTNKLFAKTYVQKINEWNKNWKEKIEFSKYLKSEHIKELKDIFIKNEKDKLNVGPGFFYKPKTIWLEFQEYQKKLINLEKEQNQIKLNGFSNRKDISKKSPVKTMKTMVC